VADVAIGVADRLDFRLELYDSREGPWEVTTPRSSCPGEEYHSSPGHSRTPVHCKIKLYRSGDLGRTLLEAQFANQRDRFELEQWAIMNSF
jgi:hypothetical protein